MRIAVAGTGYVGLVTGVCLAEKGHNVTCVDVDAAKIQKMQEGHSPIHEPGLEELMASNRERLHYTTDCASAYRDAQVVFIGVGTPEKKDGSANLKYVYAVAQQIAQSIERDCVVVVKSTVPVGTNERIEQYLHEQLKFPVRIHVVSNPEFLAQGTAVRDTLQPSRIVVGAESSFAVQVMREVYAYFDAPFLVMNRRSAEMVKYASNDFLALKISYVNEIANFCETVGADIEDVTHGMGLDARVGDRFLNAGIGYGGSCFPKDTKALSWLASFNDQEIKTIRAAIDVNESQKLKLIKKAKKYADSFSGLTIAVLGLTFKPGTDDLREAPSLVNISILLDDGARIRAWDPVGVANYKKIYPTEIQYYDTIDQTLEGADFCFIFTEWDEIKAYPPENFARLMNRPIVLDGRNCLSLEAVRSCPMIYESIGRAAINNLK